MNINDSIISFLDSIDNIKNDSNIYFEYSCEGMYESFHEKFGCFFVKNIDSVFIDSVYQRLLGICNMGFHYKSKKEEFAIIQEDYATALIYTKRYKRAEELYLKMTTQRSFDEYGNEIRLTAYLKLGDLYFLMGNLEAAKSYYKEYINFIQNDQQYIESVLYGEPFIKKKEFDYSLIRLYIKLIYSDIKQLKFDQARFNIDTCINLIMKQIDFALTKEVDVENFEYLGSYENFLKEFNSFVAEYYREDISLIEKIVDLNIILKGWWLKLDKKIEELTKIENSNRDLYIEFVSVKEKILSNEDADNEFSNEERFNLENEYSTLYKKIQKLISSDFKKNFNIKFDDVLLTMDENDAIIDLYMYNLNYRSNFSELNYNHLCEWHEEYTYDSYFAIVFRKNENPKLVKICSDSILKAYIPNCERPIREDTKNYISSPSQRKDLYNLVWGKIEKEISGIKNIYISPAGELFKVSFAALSKNDSIYLLDLYDEITYIRNLSDYVRNKNESLIPSNNKLIVLFGGMIYDLDSVGMENCSRNSLNNSTLNESDTESPSSLTILNSDSKIVSNIDNILRGSCINKDVFWDSLSGSLNEIRNISKLFQNRRNFNCLSFTDSLATEESLKLILSRNGSPYILHLSTHGFYNDESNTEGMRIISPYDYTEIYSESGEFQIRAGLIMNGGNWIFKNGKSIQGVEDGILIESEISNLNLQGTFLVTLSACETGLGEIGSGNEVWGLQRAFSVAGAENLLLTLWSIGDNTSSLFTENFYENLLNLNTNISKVLSFTQKQFRSGKFKGRNLDSPIIWGPYILIQ